MRIISTVLIAMFISFPAFADIEILSSKDEKTYREIFSYLEEEEFGEVQNLVPTLEDDILLPYVLYNKYNSKKYKSSQTELKKWLEENPDSALKSRINAILKGKGGAGVTVERAPDFEAEADVGENMIQYSYNHLPAKKAKYVKQQINNFKKAIKRGSTKNARHILQDISFTKNLKQSDLDRMRGVLAFSYFLDNEFSHAQTVANQSAKSGEYLSNWSLGLINYKNENWEECATNFKRVYENERVSSYQKSGGAYWAARCFDEIENNESSSRDMIKKACSIPYSFYGSLACERLGKFRSIKWNDFRQSSSSIESSLTNYPQGKEALALIQIGRTDYATDELLEIAKLYHQEDETLVSMVISLSQKYNLPNLSIKLSRNLKSKDLHLYHSAAYPAPEWDINWTMDKAFVYAIIKQESIFNQFACSPAGARGLMQLMPSTANFVNHERVRRDMLYEPIYNLDLGQKYLSFLIKENKDSNIVKILASYNAGPGNLRKWEKKMKYNDDPLLFIESMPSKETRGYVKNVLLNLWFYRTRFDQDNPSLSQLAEDTWPLYHSLD